MKTVAVLLLMSVFLCGLTGCVQAVEKEQVPEISPAEEVETTMAIPEFSYEEVKNRSGEGTPGVKTDGFQNVTPMPVLSETDAVERAKAECTIEYDTVLYRYDSHALMWEIVFFVAGGPGADQAVYLNREGVTQLIIYGE